MDFADFFARNNPSAKRETTNSAASAVANAVKNKDFTYYLPHDLIDVARIIAKFNPINNITRSHSLVASQIQEKYINKGNDTNTPQQTYYIQPIGLKGYLVPEHGLDEALTPKVKESSAFEKCATKNTRWPQCLSEAQAPLRYLGTG